MILYSKEDKLKLKIKEKMFQNILEKKVISNLIGLATNFNKQPTYFQNRNNMRGQSNSFFGPIKGRYMPSRNFKPY
jgi:hypothetical protein